MYSEKVISHNLEAFAAQEGWMPNYHSIAQIQEFDAYVKTLIKTESNSKTSYVTMTKNITQKRFQEIQRWIENEQVLCSLDNTYWETRYAYVCCPAEAPIWMGDYSFKPVSEVKIGDEVIGSRKETDKEGP